MTDLIRGLSGAKPAPPVMAARGLPDPASDAELRCSWGASTVDYAHYHDTEWGRPTADERTLFEKMCLEGFQSGLSWLTVLRKRPAFRAAFGDFEPTVVAEYGPADVTRLLGDAGIIRHRGKIEASISNARAMLALWADGQTLSELIWSFEPDGHRPPTSFADVQSVTPESTELSKALKSCGFRFVGPTTAYAAMQAMGVVNDHLEGCWVREDCELARAAMG